MKTNFNRKIYTLFGAVLLSAFYIGCQPEDFGEGNGLTATNVDAAFTVTPVTGKINTYVLKANKPGVVTVKWDKGDGGGAAIGKLIDTVFYPDAGTYNITLTAIGKGGALGNASQQVVVENSDPVAGNLIDGGKMETGDASKWTHFTYSPGVVFGINGGKMVATGGSGGHAGIYQSIEVVGGKKYKIDMNISGSGATDVWFEVYLGTATPGAGDYNSGGTRIALNTWAGCGKTPFNGKLSSISCAGSGNTVTFENSGTVYLVIRGGGANFGTTGISITNIEVRGSN